MSELSVKRSLTCARVVAILCIVVVLTGCTSDGTPEANSSSQTQPSPSTSPVPEPTAAPATFDPPADAAVSALQALTPRAKVIKRLAVDPILTQGPNETFSGCLYYRLPNLGPANVWQFCFNDQGKLAVVLSALALNQPEAAPDVSQARAAMIGRGDGLCQSQYGLLRPITKDVGSTLEVYGDDPSDAHRGEVVTALESFEANLRHTVDLLASYDPPPEESDRLTDYVAALGRQLDALISARKAFDSGDLDAYDTYGAQITSIGQEAETLARDYGFVTCGAATFG